MKLRNKKTGEIFDGDVFDFGNINSLTELNEEWEDVSEEEVWYLGKRIGNYSMPKKEADIVTEKILAWKRLKDKGFKFKGYTDDSGDLFSCQVIRCSFDYSGNYTESRKDLDLLFGGEEEE